MHDENNKFGDWENNGNREVKTRIRLKPASVDSDAGVLFR